MPVYLGKELNYFKNREENISHSNESVPVNDPIAIVNRLFTHYFGYTPVRKADRGVGTIHRSNCFIRLASTVAKTTPTRFSFSS